MADLDHIRKTLEEKAEQVKESEITAGILNTAEEMKDEAINLFHEAKDAVLDENGKLDKENISRMADTASKTVVETFENVKTAVMTEENKETFTRAAGEVKETAGELAGKIAGFFKKK